MVLQVENKIEPKEHLANGVANGYAGGTGGGVGVRGLFRPWHHQNSFPARSSIVVSPPRRALAAPIPVLSPSQVSVGERCLQDAQAPHAAQYPLR